MKKVCLIVMILVLCAAMLVACGTSKGMAPSSRDSAAEDDNNGDESQIPAGQITAAEWNDNENYAYWCGLLQIQQDQTSGVYKEYLTIWDFDTRSRIVVNVTKNELPVSGASVKVFKEETLLFSAVSDAKGKAYLFPKDVTENDSLTIKVSSGGVFCQRQLVFAADMQEIQIEVSADSEKLNKIEIMFVVDTTGSMSDELEYLKSEIKDVVNQMKVRHPQADITVALLFYRDTGDEYVTRYFDFTDDINVVKNNISAQSAGGGGDFPEAVHTALDEAVSKQWSTGNATKLLIHVLDAPPHGTSEVMTAYGNSIYSAAEKGIRMIPVASSGIDRGTEYLLRNEAMQTGGTYVFITNESGIGNDHLAPTVEEYVVEYLNALLVRVIEEYYTGTDIAPVPYNQ